MDSIRPIGSNSLTHTLLRTKLRPRISGAPALFRQHTIDRLSATPIPTLTLLSAPAGYGKTTTLHQFWQSLRGSDGSVTAWLSLDSNDANAATFLSYLVASLCEAGVDMAELMTAARAKLTDTPVDAVLPIFINRIIDFPSPIYLLFDDYHLASCPEVDSLFIHLMEHLSGRVHFVLSTRNRPALNLAKLQARQDVRQFGMQDLRFDRNESFAYFGYNDETTAALMETAQGWPAALQLGQLWLQRKEPCLGAASKITFTGRSADLNAYMMEQVFAALPQSLQHELTSLSILERFNGALVNSLCEVENGWTVIEDIEGRNLFITALDDESGWFSFHLLFREFLLERLQRNPSSEVAALYQRAVRWFENHGYVQEALELAQKSGEPQLLAQVLENAGGWTVALSQGVQAIRGLSTISTDTALEHPVIGLAYIYLLLQAGEILRARCMFERLFQGHLLAEPEKSNVHKVSLQFFDNILLLYEDKPLDKVALLRLRRSLRRQECMGLVERDLVIALECYMFYQRSEFEDCIKVGHIALELPAFQEAFYGAFFLYCYVGMAQFAMGRIDDAERSFKKGISIASDNYSIHSNQVKIAQALLAEVYYERNKINKARTLLSQSIGELRGSGGWFDILVASFMTKASISINDDETAEAFELLDGVERYSSERDLPYLYDVEAVHRIRLLLRCREVDEAWNSANKAAFQQIIEYDETHDVRFRDIRESALMLWAKLLAEKERGDKPLSLLAVIAQNAKRDCHTRRWLEATLIMAEVTSKARERELAFGHVEAALKMAGPAGFIRTFLDAGGEVLSLIREFADDVVVSRDKIALASARGILSQLDDTRLDLQREPEFSLSLREREILKLLARGLSGKEMARTLQIAEGTVKVHRKRLYRKLGAHSRSTALAVARTHYL